MIATSRNFGLLQFRTVFTSHADVIDNLKNVIEYISNFVQYK